MSKFLSLIGLLLVPLLAPAYTPKKPPPIRIIEDFSDDLPGRFPKSFRTWPFERDKASRVYRVLAENGNNYLAAYDAEDISIQIFRKFSWEGRRYPIFTWRWRAKVLPRGANELNPAVNDSACGVYVVFGGYSGKSVKYVWSRAVPVGAEIPKRKGKSFSVVKSSGEATGWQTVSVDVVEDYRRLFHEDPKQNPIGFGLLTDGNATHSLSACDYDDFQISKE